MNLNKKIGFLLDSGFSPSFISTLNESKINVLYEKISKTETKEQLPPGVTATNKSVTQYKIAPGTDFEVGDVSVSTKGGATTITPMNKELGEEFESKAQQGLFWARCNKCKTEDCKWCKMAKEFSKSTSKKQYKDMPEKKETKEGADYLDAVKSAMVGGMKKNLNSSLINPKLKTESKINNEFKNIIEKNLKPTMNKRDLIRLIESQFQKKNRINEDFYFESELYEAGIDFPTFDPLEKISTDVKQKEKEKTKKAYIYDYVVIDCDSRKTLFIRTKDELYIESFYKIDYNGQTKCVEVLSDGGKDNVECEVLTEIGSCDDCKGGDEEKSFDSPNIGLKRTFDKGGSLGGSPKTQRFTQHNIDIDTNKNIDQETLKLPKAKPKELDFKKSFDTTSNKLERIYNRRFKS